jgi:SAM-dependent methyltransferase
MPFSVDTPDRAELGRITRFSGWCFAENRPVLRSVILRIDGVEALSLAPCMRADVGKGFPLEDTAIFSGFVGDLILPDWVAADMRLQISLTAKFADESTLDFYDKSMVVSADSLPFGTRERAYDLNALLVDPENGSPPISPALWNAKRMLTGECRYLAGTPHFHAMGSLPLIRILEPGPTHPYSDLAQLLINELKSDQLVLDLGCGIKSESGLLPNVVLLDAVHFQNVDVVNTHDQLPFHDSCFDLVISQAVFEHLARPAEVAKEIFRVLKPGGKVLIDTAFMQPLHGDPNHYYNMTSEGLHLILEDFEILQAGVQPHQYPSFGLKMQLDAILPFMKDGRWKQHLSALADELNVHGKALDDDLGPLGRQTIAAGVYALARRPRQD